MRKPHVLFRKKLSTKLFLSYSLPLLVILGVYMVTSTHNIHREIYVTKYKQHELVNNQFIKSLESEMKEMDTTLKLAYMDVENLEKLLLGPSILGYYEARIELMKFFTQSLLLTPRKDQYVLLDTSGSTMLLCHNDAAFITLKSASNLEWFKETLAYPDKTHVFATNDLNFIAINKPCFAVSRIVMNPRTMKISAVAMLYQDMTELSDLFFSLQLSEDEIITVYDSDKNVVFSTTNSQLNPSSLSRQQGFDLVRIDNLSYINLSTSSNMTGWSVSTYIPYSRYPNASAYLSSSNIGVIISLLLLSLLLSLLFSLNITKPLSELVLSLSETERGNFNHTFNYDGKDEIAQIGRAYNSMNEKIQSLIHEKYELKLSETQARLNALQCQINPHFLFNTLNSIKAISTNDIAAKMIQSLSNMMRYTLSTSCALVPFKEELRLVKDYIYLHQCRFGDKCYVEYDIDNDTDFLSVPHLVLQPIVENAIIHGLEVTDDVFNIIITAKRYNDRFRLYVSNSGRPIEKHKIDQLNSMLKSDSPDIFSDHIGLANVWHRLRISFGDYCSMQISSSKKFTTVYIDIPSLMTK